VWLMQNNSLKRPDLIKPSAVLRLVRPKQWTKNLFVFSALVFSKHLFEWSFVQLSLEAFVAFSFTASLIYIINDAADRERDKLHPKKRFRPIASGEISLTQAFSIAALILVADVALASTLDLRFVVCLGIYFVMNLAYSFFLKELVLIDVFVIAIGFMLRVIGGALVIGVPRSSWLLLTTMFLSLFLGIAKRRGELVSMNSKEAEEEEKFHTRKVLEHYSIEFAEQMTTICAAGFVISYALYTVSDRTVKMFGTENLIMTTPFVLYGVFRYLYLLHKKNLGESPTDIVLSDIPLIVNFVVYALAMFFVIYIK
jgi:4-hydroxybenzoate polyprenyltransferase